MVANYKTCQSDIRVIYLDSLIKDKDKVYIYKKIVDLIATYYIDIGAIKWAIEE